MTWERRHPHQVLMALMCVLTGLPILLGGPQPGSLAESMPAVLLYVWAAVLVVGGALVVAAAVARTVITALFLELIADLPVALTLSTYALALVGVAGTRAAASIGIFAGAGIAFGVRFFQVTRALRRVRRSLGRAAQ